MLRTFYKKTQHMNLYYLLYSRILSTVWFLGDISSKCACASEQMKQSTRVGTLFFSLATHTYTHTEANNLPAWNNLPWFHYSSNRKKWDGELVPFSQDMLQHCHQMAKSYNYTCFDHTVETHTHIHIERERESTENLIKVGSPWQPVSLFIYLSKHTLTLFWECEA